MSESIYRTNNSKISTNSTKLGNMAKTQNTSPMQNTVDNVAMNGWGSKSLDVALGRTEEPPTTFSDLHGREDKGKPQNLNTPSDYIVKSDMDDDGATEVLANTKFTDDDIFGQGAFASIRHYNGLYYPNEVDLYNQIYRFRIMNPDTAVSNFKEVLFFTKPDLSIMQRGEDTSDYPNLYGGLNEALASRSFWVELASKYMGKCDVVRMLQGSIDHNDPFNRLLQNTVTSSIDIPALESESVETASNMYGVNLSYRGSSEGSDDSFSFSLEFRDTRWLDVYYFFRAYEEYETLKHHGIVKPWKPYIEQKIVHDQFSIYKFLLDDDMETIRYYAKYYGVYPTSLPRDTFSQTSFENGIVYNINFKAAFYEDMNPEILYDFNDLMSYNWNKSGLYDIETYNTTLDRVDTRSATAAKIVKYENYSNPRGYEYKLKWKGDRRV